MTTSVSQSGIISDANVLIDYAISAPDVLRLINTHLQKLYVASPISKEVNQLSSSEIRGLGLEIIEPTFVQLVEANKVRIENPSLSSQDAICFVMAHDNGWACLTNDKPLRKICSTFNVACIWGLEIMLSLVIHKVLSAEKALKIAVDIQMKNSYISLETVEAFQRKIGL